MQHLLHIYYGDGKGKTTAAVGAALRAAGQGLPVCFSQFMKGGESGEIPLLQKTPGITVLRPSRPYPFYRNMTAADKTSLRREHEGIFASVCQFAKKAVEISDDTPPALIVCDELLHAIHHDLIDEASVMDWIKSRPAEIIITGRGPTEPLLSEADYLTELRAVRHPFSRGVRARRGVEF